MKCCGEVSVVAVVVVVSVCAQWCVLCCVCERDLSARHNTVTMAENFSSRTEMDRSGRKVSAIPKRALPGLRGKVLQPGCQRPVNWGTADRATGRPADPPIDQPPSRLAGRPPSQPAHRPADPSAGQTAGWQPSQLVDWLDDHPVGQPADRRTRCMYRFATATQRGATLGGAHQPLASTQSIQHPTLKRAACNAG